MKKKKFQRKTPALRAEKLSFYHHQQAKVVQQWGADFCFGDFSWIWQLWIKAEIWNIQYDMRESKK